MVWVLFNEVWEKLVNTVSQNQVILWPRCSSTGLPELSWSIKALNTWSTAPDGHQGLPRLVRLKTKFKKWHWECVLPKTLWCGKQPQVISRTPKDLEKYKTLSFVPQSLRALWSHGKRMAFVVRQMWVQTQAYLSVTYWLFDLGKVLVCLWASSLVEQAK